MRNYFDHERLEVYQLELDFITWLTPFLVKIKQAPASVSIAEVLNQIDRVSISALLNTAEGNGRRALQSRAKFFDDARGSATECAACLDAMVAKQLCDKEEIGQGKEMLLRAVSVLSKLVEKFDHRVREDEGDYRIEDEDEKE